MGEKKKILYIVEADGNEESVLCGLDGLWERSFLWWMADDGRLGDGREIVVGVWGDWRKWGLMRAGGLSGFPGVG